MQTPASIWPAEGSLFLQTRVRTTGLEPARPRGRRFLRPPGLPFPPRARGAVAEIRTRIPRRAEVLSLACMPFPPRRRGANGETRTRTRSKGAAVSETALSAIPSRWRFRCGDSGSNRASPPCRGGAFTLLALAASAPRQNSPQERGALAGHGPSPRNRTAPAWVSASTGRPDRREGIVSRFAKSVPEFGVEPNVVAL